MVVSGSNLEGVVDAEIIALEEELTGKNGAELKAQVNQALEEDHRQFILDCTAMNTINSEGMEILLWIVEEVHSLGGVVKIASLGRIPKKIFELTQFNRIFEMYDDVITALKSF
jgi:anti-sigma B factor antagonist